MMARILALSVLLFVATACSPSKSVVLNERMDELCLAAYAYEMPNLDWIGLPTGPASSRLLLEMFETYDLWRLASQACDAWVEQMPDGP